MDSRWQGDPLAAWDSDWEDGVTRTTEYDKDRVSRLKALGNAIVPQVAYVILSAIREADEQGQA